VLAAPVCLNVSVQLAYQSISIIYLLAEKTNISFCMIFAAVGHIASESDQHARGSSANTIGLFVLVNNDV
jgi:hypothetical protein